MRPTSPGPEVVASTPSIDSAEAEDKMIAPPEYMFVQQ